MRAQEAVEHRVSCGARRYPRSMDETITPVELSRELGMDRKGRQIRGFLRNPTDGGGPFEGHEIGTEWHLTPEQADRIRKHFWKG